MEGVWRHAERRGEKRLQIFYTQEDLYLWLFMMLIID